MSIIILICLPLQAYGTSVERDGNEMVTAVSSLRDGVAFFCMRQEYLCLDMCPHT